MLKKDHRRLKKALSTIFMYHLVLEGKLFT